MAYTDIDDPTINFTTLLRNSIYGGSDTSYDIGFQPDWIWDKVRSTTGVHALFDSVRGVGSSGKVLYSNTNGAEATNALIKSIDSSGFTITANSDHSSQTIVDWCWKAGGTAPSQTYTVKVVSDSGNKYRFDDFGTSAVTLDLQEGGTYTFDQSDSSNSGHPLRFSTTSDGSHGGGSEYTTGVTTSGTPGSSGAKTVITVAASAPTLYYYCTQHSGMGGQANTNSTHGSSNFGGSIQSTVSANTTAGFSIATWSGSGASATIGHGLGASPELSFIKQRTGTQDWSTQATAIGYSKYLILNGNNAQANTSGALISSVDSSKITVDSNGYVNGSSNNYVGYFFSSVKGYSKIGTYYGNGSSSGTFIYCGFKPAWVLIKRYSATEYWGLIDNKRPGYNLRNKYLSANRTDAEVTYGVADLLSNGFKNRGTGSMFNTSGSTYLYMAFAENPFVNSNGIPNNGG